MFENLKLNDELTILTSSITNIDNLQLVNDLEYNCDVTIETNYGIKDSRGLQSRIHVISKNIAELRNEIMKRVIDFLKIDEDYIMTYDDWVYISENTNRNTNYHNHIDEGNMKYTKEIPQWSVVYYVQMPDNLFGTEGLLFFKTKNGEEISILPKNNQIIMFKSDVLHKPELNQKSSIKRVVYATNIAILDRNKKYTKYNKSLL